MRALVATLVIGAVLSSCGFARRHPRLTTVTIVSLVAVAVIGAPLEHECTPQPGTECGLERAAMIYGASAVVGGAIGYWAHAKTQAQAPAVESTATRRAGRPRLAVVPAVAEPEQAVTGPQVWIVPWSLPSRPLGRTPFRRGGRADRAGMTAACIGAKRVVMNELEVACRTSTRHVGIATQSVSMTPCACEETALGYGCYSTGQATCASVPDDLVALGTAAADTRAVAEANAVLAAEQACWAAGSTAQPSTSACECDAALGLLSRSCACIAVADCGP